MKITVTCCGKEVETMRDEYNEKEDRIVIVASGETNCGVCGKKLDTNSAIAS